MHVFKLKNSKIPINSWIPQEEIEEGALEQINNVSALPFAYRHIAIMPDVHQGYGVPIGGVMATEGVIVPNAVGVDIGCGMCAVKTSLTEIDRETLKKIMGEIRKAIPVGFDKHKEMQDEKVMPVVAVLSEKEDIFWLEKSICQKEALNARKSIGTLGGGNHFIEIQKGSDGFIWIMIHSGSRNLGFKVANYYNKLAVNLNEKWNSNVPKKWELAFLPIDSKEGQGYIVEMKYCVEFALANRKLMMDRILHIFDSFHGDGIWFDNIRKRYDEMINIAHNYAELENHFGQNVWIHRKGATKAYEGTIGIIPGSQGANSYIVKGKGNEDSFKSCSHGAGRRMGRKQAKKNLNLEEEVKKLEDKGILHSIRGIGQLDEAPSAYKDISIVMDNQKDLVDILVELQPLAVIKG